VVVLSPHPDDAVFSLGATIARAAREGSRVTVFTVFGGDPTSSQPAGSWDRQAGFATAGEAAVARRREDELACSLVFATPVWQTFPDEQYTDGREDESVANAVREVVADADALLLPGFPLTHADHVRVVRLVLEGRLFRGKTVLYSEQPYTLWAGRVGLPKTLRDLLPGQVRWRATRVGYRDLALKVRACRAYASQLACIPHRIVWPMSRFEIASDAVLAPIEA
jgi:LmbE family N-acetylglucosaminyl deacetylase